MIVSLFRVLWSHLTINAMFRDYTCAGGTIIVFHWLGMLLVLVELLFAIHCYVFLLMCLTDRLVDDVETMSCFLFLTEAMPLL